jgi:hypothetical protein
MAVAGWPRPDVGDVPPPPIGEGFGPAHGHRSARRPTGWAPPRAPRPRPSPRGRQQDFWADATRAVPTIGATAARTPRTCSASMPISPAAPSRLASNESALMRASRSRTGVCVVESVMVSSPSSASAPLSPIRSHPRPTVADPGFGVGTSPGPGRNLSEHRSPAQVAPFLQSPLSPLRHRRATNSDTTDILYGQSFRTTATPAPPHHVVVAAP